MQRLMRFLWYAESTRQVLEQKRAQGLFCQNTALQCAHSEATTFFYVISNSTPSFTHFSNLIPSIKQNGCQPLLPLQKGQTFEGRMIG